MLVHFYVPSGAEEMGDIKFRLGVMRIMTGFPIKIFFVLHIVMCSILFYASPPFQAPDEGTQIFRAYQISQGNIIGERISETVSGGKIDVGLVALSAHFTPYIPVGSSKISEEVYERAREINWGNMPLDADFRNTVQYGPFSYIPQAFGLLIGKSFGLSVLMSYYIARILTVCMAVTLSAIAVILFCNAREYIACICLLPMSVFLINSTSQDGVLLGVGALLSSVVAKAFRYDDPLQTWQRLGAVFCIIVLSLARAPYIALALILLTPSFCRNGSGSGKSGYTECFFYFLLTISVFFAWWIATDSVRVNVYPLNDKLISSKIQASYIINNPIIIFDLAINTFREKTIVYLRQFVGVLGWDNILMEGWAYNLSYIAIFLSSLAIKPFPMRKKIDSFVVLLAIFLSFGGIFLAQYLVWTEVGAGIVNGVQGRYFLPLAPFFPFLLPSVLGRVPRIGRAAGAMGLVLIVPVVFHSAHILGTRYGW